MTAIHVHAATGATVNITVESREERLVVERLPIAGRADRDAGIPIYSLPETLYPGDGLGAERPVETLIEGPPETLAPAILHGRRTFREAPLITMPEGGDERPPRQLTWAEQRDHLHKLPEHLHRMALFDLQCGARDDVVCSLRWAWEVIVPELDILTFIVPADHVKGQRGKKTARVVVCNSIAREIVESVRGQHPENVFVYKGRKGRSEPHPIQTIGNTAWQSWRERCGLGDLHVHDMRHTVGMRLREAGINDETRRDILWHRRVGMAGHYGRSQVIELHNAVEKLTTEGHAHNKTLETIAREQKAG